jgi:hypothetical protein
MVTQPHTIRRIRCDRLLGAILLAALAGCSSETQVTQPVEMTAQLGQLPQYAVTMYTASLGGTLSRGMAINEGGVVAGWSNNADGTGAARGRTEAITDLLTLGGPNSMPWPGLNNDGMVVASHRTNLIDPLDEDWSCEGEASCPEG